MSIRARIGLVVIWVASLVAVAALAKAQVRMNPLPSPVVLSGSDVGYRVEGRIGTTPAGTLVIRLNGKWVAPTASTVGVRLEP
jgi:hypothetical protein